MQLCLSVVFMFDFCYLAAVYGFVSLFIHSRKLTYYMQIHIECFNPFHTNCYFLTDEATGSTVIIDPACYYRRERSRMQRLIASNKWHIDRVMATHLHVDHVFGAPFMKEEYGCPLEASVADNYWVELAADRCRELGVELRMAIEPVTHWLQHGDFVRVGEEMLTVFSVPGHSPGSLAFYHAESGSLFSGDTLFKRGIGRTDLPGGNKRQLAESIRYMLCCFPDDTVVYPGHDEPTTIGEEKRLNPYLK